MQTYKLDDLVIAYLDEHPDFSETDAHARAQHIRAELKSLDRHWNVNQADYYDHTLSLTVLGGSNSTASVYQQTPFAEAWTP